MDLEKLKNLLKDEKSYRLKQAEKAVYMNCIKSWHQLTSLPAEIRYKLENEVPIIFKAGLIKSVSEDTIKAAIKLDDGLNVETVLLMHHGGNGQRERNTVCVSSQAGCPMGCVFCRTAGAGFKRNLTSYEIVQQVLFFKYYLNESSKKITNIVFMGMGEPFLNYKNVIEAVKIINDKDRINIGSRKISISTCGIPGMIIKLAEEKLQVNLAVSLNAADDSLRGRLMPVNNKYPLNSLLTSIGKYIEKTNRRVMFEYVMLKGINDSTGDAEKLSCLLKRNNLRPGLYFINLIPFNGKGQLSAPDPGRIKRFKEILEKENIIVTRRYRFGSDISGACGQLVYSNL